MIRIETVCALILALFVSGCNVDAQPMNGSVMWPDPAPGAILDGSVEMYY